MVRRRGPQRSGAARRRTARPVRHVCVVGAHDRERSTLGPARGSPRCRAVTDLAAGRQSAGGRRRGARGAHRGPSAGLPGVRGRAHGGSWCRSPPGPRQRGGGDDSARRGGLHIGGRTTAGRLRDHPVCRRPHASAARTPPAACLLTRAPNALKSVVVLVCGIEDSRHTLPFAGCPGSVAIAGGPSPSRGVEAGGHGTDLRRDARGHRSLAAPRRTGPHHVLEVQAARPAEGYPLGAAPSRDDGAADHRPLSGPTQAAVCPVDPRVGAATAGRSSTAPRTGAGPATADCAVPPGAFHNGSPPPGQAYAAAFTRS